MEGDHEIPGAPAINSLEKETKKRTHATEQYKVLGLDPVDETCLEMAFEGSAWTSSLVHRRTPVTTNFMLID